MKLNKNFVKLQDDYLFAEVAKRVDAYKKAFPTSDVISLGIGDVTQPLSMKVADACKDAATELTTRVGFHGYGPYEGYPFLKNAIINYYKRNKVEIDADEVFVTDGAKETLSGVLDLFDTSNTVMIPDPVYPAYVDANVMDGRKIIYVDGNRGNGFLPMPPERAKPDIIYICSPNNPTGTAYNKEQLKAWVDYALSKKAIILYDSAYEGFIDKGSPAVHSIFEITGARDCAIEISSMSKLAGFTGIRCGWVVIPMALPLNRMWLRRQSTKYNGTSYVVQRMAERALTGGYEEILKNLSVYKSNAKLITTTFDNLKIEYFGGKDSPYVWFFCGIKSWEFFDYLLKKARIVVTPGSGFGKNGEGWIRITSFNTPDRITDAMKRFEVFWKEYVQTKDTLFSAVK